ncbi:hypothetical protein KUV85_09235 [Nocardioides panacisoli]|uniref:hypothetical protein n=1 Tax=Nocardioides panacisoli TaxID=627624 RepID=UPI001C62A035|nr:hypothetical protein [Nocardioides panacisoli]QYJ02523.1 hypothetical protein KUV85_09235 [Nocardioides panacisoli]
MPLTASPTRTSIGGRVLAPLAAVVTTLALAATVAPAAGVPAGAGARGDTECTTLFAGPTQVARAERRKPAAFAAAARGNPADVAKAAEDPSAWFDVCGKVYYVEPAADPADIAAADAAQEAAAAASGPVAAYADTFTLNSLPGSDHTIYLDFDGGTVTGTAWNGTGTERIDVTPYDDGGTTDANFTDAELRDIQDTWSVVAADYAAFDVNVTTQWPGQDALTRSDETDDTYGSHVMITNGPGNPIYDDCDCGGVAYVDVFDIDYGHGFYQPAWVFAGGTGPNGKSIGEATSHEVGHNLGLLHDGTTSTAYYDGSDPWAPIMGVGYYQPVTQFSRGEYADADNTEDDIALITDVVPERADDHADSAEGAAATELAAGEPAAGLVSSSDDVDAFTFTGAGTAEVEVAVPAHSDLDVALTVSDATGRRLAEVDPQVTWTSASTASGLGASWSGTLPTAGGTWVLTVEGTGNDGSGLAYSDYGSLGAYTVTVTDRATAEPDPVDVRRQTRTAFAGARTSTRLEASGGDGTYAWEVVGGSLPPGMGIGRRGYLFGTPRSAGTWRPQVLVTSGTGDAVVHGTARIVITVEPRFRYTTRAWLPVAQRGRWFKAVIRTDGAHGQVRWLKVRGSLPRGLWRTTKGDRIVIKGRGKQRTRTKITLRGIDRTGRQVQRTFVVRVR